MKKYLSSLAIIALVAFTGCKDKEVKEVVIEEVIEEVKKTPPAKVQAPQPSPFSKIEQKVGLTDVTVEYSRPGMKGRTIYGDLVPYGKVWRT